MKHLLPLSLLFLFGCPVEPKDIQDLNNNEGPGKPEGQKGGGQAGNGPNGNGQGGNPNMGGQGNMGQAGGPGGAGQENMVMDRKWVDSLLGHQREKWLRDHFLKANSPLKIWQTV